MEFVGHLEGGWIVLGLSARGTYCGYVGVDLGFVCMQNVALLLVTVEVKLNWITLSSGFESICCSW